MTKAIKNEFRKYWHPEFKDWHAYEIGTYHVSSIGCSHQHLESDEHSGPCIRQTYYEYTDPLPNSDETDGLMEEGNEHHEKLQKIIKKWKPNSIIEYPVSVLLTREVNGVKETIALVGSVDILYKHLFDLTKDDSSSIRVLSIWDIKTCGQWTVPLSRYDKNPTHFDQVDLYSYMALNFEFNPETHMIKRKKLIYVNKHQKGTYVQRETYRPEKAKAKYEDAEARCWYLHDCLVREEPPIAEPMHWCKYCKYVKRCIADGGVEPILYKNGKIKSMEVYDDTL